jgi:FAD/FMN-containing dehydrogenase
MAVRHPPGPEIGGIDMTASNGPPGGFPAGIEVYQEQYQNWSGDLQVDNVWTCAPNSPDEVVAVVNWAHGQGWKVRARGLRRSWAPLTVTPDKDPATVMLVDTTRHLTQLVTLPGQSPAVRAQVGASIEQLAMTLGAAGLGMVHHPGFGSLTVGGVLATAGHGSAVPAGGETATPGGTFGSLSNLVVSLTAVVWDAGAGAYTLRTFDRADPEVAALLTPLGRVLITEVTLRVVRDTNLRCVSRTDIPATELFAPGGASGRTLASFVDSAGRVEAIWFVFTDRPWLKYWSVSPQRPLTSRAVSGPYNYPYTDTIPQALSDLASQLLAGAWELTPACGALQFTVVDTGLTATFGRDLWGPSRYLLLYLKPHLLRVITSGIAVHTSRAGLQQVVNDFSTRYQTLVASYQARNLYPVSSCLEMRVTGTDRAGDVGVPGAQVPALSPTRPRADHPEWDTVAMFNVVTFSSAPGVNAFFRDLEEWAFGHFEGARVEWPMGWGYTTTSPWAEPTVITQTVPDSFRAGGDPGWDNALATFAALDPHRVVTNPFLDQLLP